MVSCAIDTSTYETTTTLHPSSTSSGEPSTETIKRDIKQKKKTLLRNLTLAPSVMVSIDRIDVSQLKSLLLFPRSRKPDTRDSRGKPKKEPRN